MNQTNLKIAVTALLAKKTRTFLTILGLSIGIAVVIAIMAAGRGLNYMVKGQLDVYSPKSIDIEPKVPSAKKTSSANAFGQASGITITTLDDHDLEDIRKHPNISTAYGLTMGQAVIKYGGETKISMLMGEGYNFTEVEKTELDEGRIFTEDEELSLAQVVLLGSALKETLFGDAPATGQTVYIKGKSFRVVGVMKKKGASFGMDMDNLAIMPVTTMQRKILGIDYLRMIMANSIDVSQLDSTIADLEEIIRDNHDITNPDKDDFAVTSMKEAADILSSVVQGITLLLIALVCVSLAVGGVGIMNIMYVSVTERTFEIGLRKALGAKRKDILCQFLTEAVLLTLAGGVVGVILGAVLAGLIYLIAVHFNFIWIYSIPISSIILAVGFSAAIGLFFGLYPAKVAASLDPVAALRKE